MPEGHAYHLHRRTQMPKIWGPMLLTQPATKQVWVDVVLDCGPNQVPTERFPQPTRFARSGSEVGKLQGVTLMNLMKLLESKCRYNSGKGLYFLVEHTMR